MGILDNPKEIIKGLKPHQKNRPQLRMEFDKAKPLGPYNFPQLSYAYYKLYGYKKDAAGIRHPVEFVKKLPMGQRIRFAKDDFPGITITDCERLPYGPII